jgi:hypothetical protein
MEDVRRVIDEMDAAVATGGGVAHVTSTITDCDSVGEPTTAWCGFQIQIWLAGLFDEGGPLYDVRLCSPSGEVDERRLDAGHLSAARKFMRRHLARSPFRPTIALDLGWLWRLVSAKSDVSVA